MVKQISVGKLLFRINQLQAALNTVNSVASSQAVNSVSRAISLQTSSIKPTINTSGQIITIDSGNVYINAAVFSPGNTFYIHNNSSSANITITQNTGVLIYRSNSINFLPATGNFNVAPKGYVTITCTAANVFVVSGIGVV